MPKSKKARGGRPKATEPVAAKKEAEAPQPEAEGDPLRFRYQCPACSNDAVHTSNKMLGVEVDCMNCGKRIELDDPKRYMSL